MLIQKRNQDTRKTQRRRLSSLKRLRRFGEPHRIAISIRTSNSTANQQPCSSRHAGPLAGEPGFLFDLQRKIRKRSWSHGRIPPSAFYSIGITRTSNKRAEEISAGRLCKICLCWMSPLSRQQN